MECSVVSCSESPLKHFNSLSQAIRLLIFSFFFFYIFSFDSSSLQSNVPSPPTERAPAHLEDTEYSFKRLEWNKY